MKTRIIALVAVGAFAFGCGDKDKKKGPEDREAATEPEAGEGGEAGKAAEPKAPPRPRNLSPQETLAAAQECWKAAGGDAEALDGCYGEGAVVELVDGVPAEAAVLEELRDGLAQMTVEPQLVVVNGSTLASVLLVKGKVKETVWGVGSAGKDVSFYVGQMAQAGGEDVDGQIDPELVRDFWYLDQATLLAQVGAQKRAGAPARAEALPEPREVVADPTEKMTESFAAFNKGYMAAGQKSDMAAMADAYAENAVVRYVPQAKAIEGKKAIGAWLGKLGDGFKLSMRRQWGAGDWIVAETLADGKVGDEAYQVKRLELLRYADRTIAEHWIFVNELDRMVDVGEFDPAKLTVAPKADAAAGDAPAGTKPTDSAGGAKPAGDKTSAPPQ